MKIMKNAGKKPRNKVEDKLNLNKRLIVYLFENIGIFYTSNLSHAIMDDVICFK